MDPARDQPSHSFRFIKLFGRTISCRIEPDSGEDAAEAAMFKRLKASDADRISRLPDELLVSVLSLMTTKQSVKTSILSKRWQHLWKSVPVLDFIEEATAESLSDTIPRVDTVLALHRSPQIVKFRLYAVYDDDDEFSSDVDHWLSYALTKNVKVVDLALPPFIELEDVQFEAIQYVLPDFVYDDGSSVDTLSLRFIQMLPHNNPISWTSLKLLLLTNVQLTNLSIREIISGCPSITTFSLCYCSGFDQMYIDSKSGLSELIIDGYVDSPALNEDTPLEIQAPGLRSVELLGTIERFIRVIDLSAVVDAKLEFHLETDYDDVLQVYPIVLRKLLKKLRHVGNLTIGTWCSQVLSAIAVQDLPSLQSKYEFLTLHTCLRKLDLPGISCLLKSSADLQTLVVDIACNCYTLFGEVALDDEFLSPYEVEGKNYWSSMGIPVCLTTSVTTITIKGFKGERLEIDFLQFLLEHARMLQKMIIHAFKNNGYGTQRQASKLEGAFAQLLSFPRSSINAVILFS